MLFDEPVLQDLFCLANLRGSIYYDICFEEPN